MEREEIEKVLEDVMGEGESRFASKTDWLMAALLLEIRALRKSPAVVNNFDGRVMNGASNLGHRTVGEILPPPPTPYAVTYPKSDFNPTVSFSSQPRGAIEVMPGDEVTTTAKMRYPLDRKIPVIKAIREALGMGLKEAKDMSEADTFMATRWQLRALSTVFQQTLPGVVTLYHLK